MLVWVKVHETEELIDDCKEECVLESKHLKIMELVGNTAVGKFEYDTWEEAYREVDRLQKIALESGHKLTEVRYAIRHGEDSQIYG